MEGAPGNISLPAGSSALNSRMMLWWGAQQIRGQHSDLSWTRISAWFVSKL